MVRRSYPLLRSTMRILSEADVKRCLPISVAIAANRKALSSLLMNQDGGASVPTRIGIPYHSKESSSTTAPADWSLFKPAAYYPPPQSNTDDEILMGVKVVSPRANNAKKNKPTCPATIMLLNAETGETSAVVAATYLTAARTAAGSALATEMACPNSADGLTLVVFGAGLQGELHIKAIQHVVNLKKVVIVNRSKERAEKLKESLLSIDATEIEVESKTRIPIKDISIVLLSDTKAVQDAVEIADVIATATNTCEPLFSGDWPKPGCHVNGVGSYTPLMKEIDDALVKRCEVLIDTNEALDVGDLSSLINDDGTTKQNFSGLIGDALVGNIEFGKHRNNNFDCTFFKSVGTAIQDVVTAQFVYEYARKEGIGTTFDM
jgi:ornithine cyclodeaminase